MTMRGALLVSLLSISVGCASATSGEPLDPGNAGGTDASGSGSEGGSILPILPDAGILIGDGSPRFGGEGGDPSKCADLVAVLRDFRGFAGPSDQPRHPDFEDPDMGLEKGLVEASLGPDRKPVLASATGTKSISSPDSFRQWYTDVDGVNQRFELSIHLEPDPARPEVFVYSNNSFFPLDDKGWGNQYQSHNYHFTTEIHLRFTYKSGEVFTFIGDDDLFLFINDRLAIDLGGIHGEQTGTVDLDEKAAELGITPGQTYAMDIFHAERHTSRSNFRMETTIDCFVPVLIP